MSSIRIALRSLQRIETNHDGNEASDGDSGSVVSNAVSAAWNSEAAAEGCRLVAVLLGGSNERLDRVQIVGLARDGTLGLLGQRGEGCREAGGRIEARLSDEPLERTDEKVVTSAAGSSGDGLTVELLCGAEATDDHPLLR